MSAFRDIPLGQPVPNSPHAVLCSLPRLADVIGYEERRPETIAAMRTGYPRFLTNPLVAQAQELAAKELQFKGREARLVITQHLAEGLVEFVGDKSAKLQAWCGSWAVDIAVTKEAKAAAKAFLQHTGASITSRQAEDILVEAGALAKRHPEKTFAGDASAKVRANLAESLGIEPASILLTGSGMAAFFAIFEAARAIQRPRGRTVWLQLGWQYVDTTEILKKFLGPEECFHFWADEYDDSGLASFFERHSDAIAGVIAEFPTNPLLHAANLRSLHSLCARHGAILIADPTLASPQVVNVLPHCDVLFNSLTKFAGNEADVMGGAVAFNPASPWAHQLARPVAKLLAPPYPRDLARLAAQIDGYAPLVDKACDSAARLVHFLEKHPAVKTVHWAGEPLARKNFDHFARQRGRYGSVFSFVLKGDLARFYDRIKVVKGPSFGTNFTMLCPFMYLAHYDLVSTPQGRAQLQGLGIDPGLIRVSVGIEPYEEIEAAFAEALRG